MNTARVGRLERSPSGSLAFQYATEWLADPKAIPISLSLPLREDQYTEERVSPYFDNLLPDNTEIRRRIAETTEAADASIFELLRVIGRDCIGALQLLPEDEAAPTVGRATGEVVTPKAIHDILERLPIEPAGSRAEPFRISIAGAQNKTAFLKLQKQWLKPSGSTPTTHIFKPPIGKLPQGVDLTQSVQNEWLCLALAQALGLPVARTQMQTFKGLACLVVERFDRRWSADEQRLLRLPQEDLCQALRTPPLRKYESQGGPGIARIMDFLNGSDHPEEDRAQFMRAQLVFYLLGGVDGHAKNFSIHLTRAGFRLTPLYDVMTIWPALQSGQIRWKNIKMAMTVGKSRHYEPQIIQKRHWFETAKQSGFDARVLERLMEDLQVRLKALLQNPLVLPKGFPKELYTATLQMATKQAQRLQ